MRTKNSAQLYTGGYSEATLWADFPYERVAFDPSWGRLFRWSPVASPVLASGDNVNGIQAYLDTGCTAQGRALSTSAPYPALALSVDNTDNDSVAIEWGCGLQGQATISRTAGISFDVFFEAVIDTTTIAETALAVGMATVNKAADDFLADNTGALGDFDFIGFHAPAAASTCVVDAIYRKTGETAVVVNNDCYTQAVNTVVRLGWRYKVDTGKILYYVNGVEQSSAASVTASTFPLNVALTPFVGIKSGNTTAKELGLFGISCGVLYR
jgi:hypothetical protein